MQLSIFVEPSWILELEYRVAVNKVAAVYQELYEEDLEVEQVVLDVGAAIWRVWTPVVIHIPR